jgi:DNA-binding response OmpR family regulator
MKQIHEIRPGTKVIIITGHGSASEREAGIEAGACFYLMKPINLEELIEKMHEVTES